MLSSSSNIISEGNKIANGALKILFQKVNIQLMTNAI